MSLSITIQLVTLAGMQNIMCGDNISIIDNNINTLTGIVTGGNPVYIYKWIYPNGDIVTGQSISIIISGVHTLTITDSSSPPLTSTCSINITINDPNPLVVTMELTSSPRCNLSKSCRVKTLCCGSKIKVKSRHNKLTALVTNGAHPYLYSWFVPSGKHCSGQTVDVKQTGTYNVTVTDSSVPLFVKSCSVFIKVCSSPCKKDMSRPIWMDSVSC